MSLSLRTHKGKQILYVDYGVLNFENMINLLYDSCHVLKKTNKKMLLLTNFENATVSPPFIKEVRRLGKKIISDKVTKTALLGIYGTREKLVKEYILFTGEENVKTFETEQKAIEWLVS